MDRGGLDLGLLAFLLALLPSLPPLVHDPVVRDPRKCPPLKTVGPGASVCHGVGGGAAFALHHLLLSKQLRLQV